jgi:N-acetyl-anhydromuramyl-L-alanine amidase AmpD
MNIERDPQHITSIIIHCSASPNGKHVTAADIDSWHKARGFNRHGNARTYHAPRLKHIGYHFVIQLNGVVDCGRALREVGAHAHGHNQDSIGICLIGTDKFTRPQWDSLRDCITGLRRDYPNIIDVVGHNQLTGHKACPGFSVRDWLANDKRPPTQHVLPMEETDCAQS